MSGLNKNIEEIKHLLPDYISGNISAGDRKIVDNALGSSAELTELLSEMTGTLGFVSKVKFKEPDSLYWTNLLPRIHERIEQAENKKFSWQKVLSYWKIFVPVTAAVLLAVLYFSLFNKFDESTITEKKIEKTDTVKKNTEKQDIVKENKSEIDNNSVKEDIKIIPKSHKNVKPETEQKQNDIVKETLKQDEPETIAEMDIEEESVFTGGTAGMIDDEIESSLNTLSQNEQEDLIKKLNNL